MRYKKNFITTYGNMGFFQYSQVQDNTLGSKCYKIVVSLNQSVTCVCQIQCLLSHFNKTLLRSLPEILNFCFRTISEYHTERKFSSCDHFHNIGSIGNSHYTLCLPCKEVVGMVAVPLVSIFSKLLCQHLVDFCFVAFSAV